MIRRSLGFVCLTLALVAAGAAQAAEHRIGLVIGEARYRAGALTTPANDAGLIAQALASDGVEVTGYADLDLAGTRKALGDFLAKARSAGPETAAIVYLAGYGVQFSGDDFLIPVDATIARDVDVPSESVRLGDFARDLAALPLEARVLIYDLARSHPFAQGGTPLASGLAMAAPQAGLLVAFNTAPGLVAAPEDGDYGLYALALSEMLRTKGLGMDTVFSRLRARVDALSNGGAVPWTEGTLDTPLVLLPPASDAPSLLSPFRALMPGGALMSGSAADAYWTAIQRDTLPAYSDFVKAYPHDPLAARVAVLLAARREAMMWLQTRRMNTAAAYWTYMRRYPRGPHFADARRGLAALPAALEPPPRFDLVTFPDLPAPRPEELALINRPFVPLDNADDVPVPPPPASVLPEGVVAVYDRLPPLLAVRAGTLPLPVPLGAAPGFARIDQPDLGGPGGLVVATEGVDKTGDPALRQTDGAGHLLSTAIRSAGPTGTVTVTQTGPDNQLVLTTVAVAGANGGRSVTQTGADKQVIATLTTLVAAGGNRVTTLSGPDGLPRSIVATTPSGTIIKPKGAELRLAAAPALIRPVVVPAPVPRRPTPPPLATGQPIGAIVTPPIAAKTPSHPASPTPAASAAAPAASPQRTMAPPLIVPKAGVAPVAPTLPSIAPTIVPEPAVPSVAPVVVPSPAAPIVAVPTMPAPSMLAPPTPAPSTPAPPMPSASPAPMKPRAAAPPPATSAPAPAPAAAVSAPAPGAAPASVAAKPEAPATPEPVPPRKTPEPGAEPPAGAPEPRREKPAATLAQPTPPRRPRPPEPAKAAPHGSAKPARKAPPPEHHRPGKRRS